MSTSSACTAIGVHAILQLLLHMFGEPQSVCSCVFAALRLLVLMCSYLLPAAFRTISVAISSGRWGQLGTLLSLCVHMVCGCAVSGKWVGMEVPGVVH